MTTLHTCRQLRLCENPSCAVQDTAALDGRLHSGDRTTNIGRAQTLDGMFGGQNAADDMRLIEDNMRLAEGQLHDLTL